MARTIHGNLTGRAAAIELREQRERIKEQISASVEKFLLDYGDAIVALKALDPEGFSDWYDNCPERTTGTMYPVMLARIKELEAKKCLINA
jgi:hypothetical protein